MNETTKDIFKLVLADRKMSMLLITFIAATIVYCLYVGFSLQPSDLQVAVHYTAYGETNYYRERWYYLLTFIGFGIVLAGLNTAVAAKLLSFEKRPLAIGVSLLSFALLFITWVLTRSVLGVAFLS